MSRALSKAIKLKVAQRASFRCEYCQIHEDDLFVAFEIDHIVSLKHGGGNEIENLAYSCPHCNQYKGTDLTTFLDSYHHIIPIFHPRQQKWEAHFKAEKGIVLPNTEVGKATIKLLRINNPEIVALREILQELGRYP